MKKVLWLIVCLMTMVVSFTSCGENIKEKYAVDNNEVFAYAPKNVVNEFFNAVDRDKYLRANHDPSELTYVRTTLHVATDTLVVGEVYVRGRNVFGSSDVNGQVYIFLNHDKNAYLKTMSIDDWDELSMRIGLCNTNKEKNEVFSRLALAHGIVNDETDLEHLIKITEKNKSSYKNDFREYCILKIEEELGISKKENN